MPPTTTFDETETILPLRPCLLLAVTIVSLIAGCEQSAPALTIEIPKVLARTTKHPAPSSDLAIAEFCSACHAFPNPQNFPRDEWRREVEQAFTIFEELKPADLVPTDREATIAWFEERAPEAYVFEPSDALASKRDTRFERLVVRGQGDNDSGKAGSGSASSGDTNSSDYGSFGAVAHFRPLHQQSFLIADTDTGLITKARLEKTVAKDSASSDSNDSNDATIDGHPLRLVQEVIGTAGDPVHVEPTDLDGDGVTDYVVADMGSLYPGENHFGTVGWFRLVDEQWRFAPLATGRSRTCDVQPIDYDGDGNLDLLCASFGFRSHGQIEVLMHQGLVDGIPSFRSEILDQRQGAIQLPVVDLDGDGKLDWLSLVSQEHEMIEAHLNQGDGQYSRELIFQAPDPAYSSSGIDVVDMDGDGDLDVLYTNGDTFDDFIAKPFHSVQWLENEGRFPFTHHHITSMPGVYRAVAGDIDLDGDQDIVAVALLSPHERNSNDVGPVDGVIWLEQLADETFARHSILAGQCDWATCQLMDVDGDDDLDLLLSRFSQDSQLTSPLIVYRNKNQPTVMNRRPEIDSAAVISPSMP